MNNPAFQRYKETGVQWAERIPVHWDIAPLKRLLDIRNGRDHKAVEQDQGYPVIGSGGQFAFASDYLYDGEAVLLGRKGTIDKPLYIKGRFWTVDTMYWAKIRSEAHGRFAYYAASTIPFSYYTTDTALPSMTKGSLGRHPLAVPPINEQKIIADLLDRETARIDLLIEKKQRLVALLGEKTAETIRQCVSWGMDSNVPKKPSRVPAADDLAAHWTEQRLSTICRFVQGKAHEPFIEDDGEYICVTARFVSTNGEKFRRCTKNLTPGKEKDIAMVMSDLPNGRALARAFLVDQDDLYAINQRVCAITVMTGDPRFFYYQLDRNFQLLRYNDGFNQTHLPNRAFTQLFLKVPPVDEQKRIADYLEAVSKHTNAVTQKTNASIDRLKEYRSALITAAVTGQIDVQTHARSGTTDRRLDAIEEEMGA